MAPIRGGREEEFRSPPATSVGPRQCRGRMLRELVGGEFDPLRVRVPRYARRWSHVGHGTCHGRNVVKQTACQTLIHRGMNSVRNSQRCRKAAKKDRLELRALLAAGDSVAMFSIVCSARSKLEKPAENSRLRRPCGLGLPTPVTDRVAPASRPPPRPGPGRRIAARRRSDRQRGRRP